MEQGKEKRTLSRRRFIAVTAGTVTVGLLQACAQPAAQPTAAPTSAPTAAPKAGTTPAPQPTAKPATQPTQPPAQKKKVTIQQWFNQGGDQLKHVESIAAKFMEQNKDIEIVTTTVMQADMSTKLGTAIAGGSPPEIAHIGGANITSSVIAAGQCEPLNNYRKDIATLDWLGPLKEVLIRDGTMYAVPVNSGSLGFFYNADLYKASGLDPAKPPATWDDLVKYTQAIAKPDKQIWGHYIGTKVSTWAAGEIWVAYLWQAGGDFVSPDGTEITFNSEAGVEALQFWVDLVQKYKVTPLKTVDPAVMGGDFGTGNVGSMTLYPVWVAKVATMNFKGMSAKLPKYKQEATPLGFGSAPIFKGAKEKEAAWVYLDWLMQPENAIAWVKGLGNLPTRLSMRDEPAWKEYAAGQPLVSSFAEAQPSARLSYYGPGSVELTMEVAKAIEAAIYGQKTAKQALDDAAKTAADVLKRERAKQG
ncbi:MAG: ABC transporter substrate-binding protein [Chloroflexota bacterium]